MFDVINSQPTANVAEIVHGKWIDEIVENHGVADVKSVCSECGKPNKRYKPPYCPHCGVKMDKEMEKKQC